MSVRKQKKYIIENNYVAEVEVELIDNEDGWSPYLGVEDALKLDKIRKSLKQNDIQSIRDIAKIYTLSPVAA